MTKKVGEAKSKEEAVNRLRENRKQIKTEAESLANRLICVKSSRRSKRS
jgi:hypothetical protein